MEYEHYVFNTLSVSMIGYVVSDDSLEAGMDTGIQGDKFYYIDGRMMATIFSRMPYENSEHSNETEIILRDNQKNFLTLFIKGKYVRSCNEIGTFILKL